MQLCTLQLGSSVLRVCTGVRASFSAFAFGKCIAKQQESRQACSFCFCTSNLTPSSCEVIQWTLVISL